MKRVTLFLYVIGLCLGLAVNVNASALTITAVDSYWEDIKQPGVSVQNREDSDKIKWGTGSGKKSSLTYTTAFESEDIDLDSAFSIGTLAHENNPISTDSIIPSASLYLTLYVSDSEIANYVFSLTFELTFDIDETENQGTPEEQADHVSLADATSVLEATVDVDGITYTYTLEFLGFSATGESTYSTSMTSYENATTTNELWVTLTRTSSSSSSETNPVPEPATMALLGFGMLGLAGLAGRKRKK